MFGMLADLTDGDKAIVGAMFATVIVPTWLIYATARFNRKELKPNGGGSAKDQLTRIDETVKKMAADVSSLKRGQHLHSRQIRKIVENQSKTSYQVDAEQRTHSEQGTGEDDRDGADMVGDEA